MTSRNDFAPRPDEKHAAALRDAFAPFIGSARRAGGSPVGSRPRMSTRTSKGAGRPREETAAIREWAIANGLEVSTRGRISSTVLEAYENRGNSAATAAPAVEPVVEPAAETDAKPKRRTRKKATAEV